MNLIKKDLLNKKIIIFFILMTPIIDLFNGFFDYVLQVKISPGLFVRTAILMVILYFYISQKKKNIYKVIIIGMAFLIQLLCWSWINDSEISFLSEVSFVAKIYYNIFLILVLDYYFAVKREKSYDYTEAIITSSLIITVSLIITRILGIGVSAYGVGEGYKGLFIGLNDLTIVLGIAFPFILYKAIASEERIKYVIYSVFVGGNILMIGTKTSIVVMLISILFIGYYICVKNNKRSQRVIFLVSVILGGIIFIILFRNSLEAIIERQKYFFEKSDFFTFLLSGRNFTMKNALEIWSKNPINIILGVGFTKGAQIIGGFLPNHGMIEMDLVDILYFYGIIFFGIVTYILVKKLLISLKIIYKSRSVYNKIIALNFILTFILSNLGGHVLLSPFAGVYFALIYALISSVDINEEDRFFIESKSVERKVYHIGPDMNLKGGIATIIKQISLAQELNKLYSQQFISTVKVKRVCTYIKAVLLTLDIEEGSIVHFHVASNGSFIRKYILFRLVRGKTKKIIHIHGGDFVNYYKCSNKLIKICINDMINNSDCIASVSDYMINDLKNQFANNNEKIIKIYNGIKLNDTEVSFSDKENIILYMGKVIGYKGIYDLIEAIDKIKDILKVNEWKVVIAGDGEVIKVNQIIKERQLTGVIDVIGWIDGMDKEKLLRKAKITVIPSHIESFGISAVEGMAFGSAIIATNVGALPELIINNENGFIISKGDDVELARKIGVLIENEQLIKEICYKNVKHSKCFSEEKMIERIIQKYNELVGE